MAMMSIYISSSPHVLLHNHTSVTMVGSTHRFERAVQIGPGNHSLWPTLACFDLQRPRPRRAQPLFVDSSLAARTHRGAATQVPWCTTGFSGSVSSPHDLPPPPPPQPQCACSSCLFILLRRVWRLVLPKSADRVAWRIICA